MPAAAGEEADPTEQLKWALTAELGVKPRTRSEHGAWGDAISQLVEAGATPEQISGRCAAYRKRWPKVALTPMALVRWWGMLEAAAEGFSGYGDETRLRWIEDTSWQLDLEDARWIVDEWPDISPAERRSYHELVDRRAETVRLLGQEDVA